MEWFIKSALLLETIKGDTHRLDLVLELQRMLLRRIARSEKAHRRLERARRRLKARLARERLSKEKSQETKALVQRIQQRFEELENLRFLYRCFGDGIASVYQSTFSLRHFFFGQRSFLKEGPGFLTDKEGFRREYKALKIGIKMGVPVVLTDLTNLIRHGDICALAGREPRSIEMKSFAKLGARGMRQQKELKTIHDFLHGDGSADFRGMKSVERVELKFEMTYAKHMNMCVREAMNSGIAQFSPEDGLHYVAIRNDYAGEHPGCLQPIYHGLPNSAVDMRLAPDINWLPMYPFTLSLSPGNAVLYMQGAFHLRVFVDMKVVKTHFASIGIHAVTPMDGVTAIQICIDPNDLLQGTYRISEMLFRSVAWEFIGIKNFSIESSKLLTGKRLARPNQDERDLISSPPEDWSQARDFFDDSSAIDVTRTPASRT